MSASYSSSIIVIMREFDNFLFQGCSSQVDVKKKDVIVESFVSLSQLDFQVMIAVEDNSKKYCNISRYAQYFCNIVSSEFLKRTCTVCVCVCVCMPNYKYFTTIQSSRPVSSGNSSPVGTLPKTAPLFFSYIPTNLSNS